MVQRISPDKREVAVLLKRQTNLSIGDIATICAISPTSVLKFTKPPVEEKKKPGRKPKKVDTKKEKQVLRTFRRVKRENRKVTVKRLSGESGVAVGTVTRVLAQNGYAVEPSENTGEKEIVKVEPPKPEPKQQTEEEEDEFEQMDVL